MAIINLNSKIIGMIKNESKKRHVGIAELTQYWIMLGLYAENELLDKKDANNIKKKCLIKAKEFKASK